MAIANTLAASYEHPQNGMTLADMKAAPISKPASVLEGANPPAHAPKNAA